VLINAEPLEQLGDGPSRAVRGREGEIMILSNVAAEFIKTKVPVDGPGTHQALTALLMRVYEAGKQQEREKWHRRIRKAAKSVEARHSDATADELFSLLSAGIYVSPLLGELDTVKE
jgi:hypothetical protein